jgi:hypothetical protein
VGVGHACFAASGHATMRVCLSRFLSHLSSPFLLLVCFLRCWRFSPFVFVHFLCVARVNFLFPDPLTLFVFIFVFGRCLLCCVDRKGRLWRCGHGQHRPKQSPQGRNEGRNDNNSTKELNKTERESFNPLSVCCLTTPQPLLSCARSRASVPACVSLSTGGSCRRMRRGEVGGTVGSAFTRAGGARKRKRKMRGRKKSLCGQLGAAPPITTTGKRRRGRGTLYYGGRITGSIACRLEATLLILLPLPPLFLSLSSHPTRSIFFYKSRRLRNI